MSGPYIVLRHSPDIPDEHRAPHYEGRWIEHDPNHVTRPGDKFPGVVTAIAEPTGRTETRDDGAVAEVWEIRLTQPDAP